MPYTLSMSGDVATEQRPTLWTAAVRALELSLGWMPEGPCRAYWTWALASDTHRDEWLQVSGLAAIVRLYESMFARFLTADERTLLVPYAAAIIVQQTYEVLTDNLAIGLAEPASTDRTAEARRHVLAIYNRVMVDKLGGAKESVAQLLEPARAAASELSAFAQNHNPGKTRTLASAFTTDTELRAALDHDLWPALVASCEATLALGRQLTGTAIGPMVTAGLAARYWGVSALIAGEVFGLEKRLTIGADTILVRPTLAFFAGVLAQEIRPMSAWAGVVADGTLGRALGHSALLVRLLNDVGTVLLTADDAAVASQIVHLQDAALAHENTTLRALFGECLTALGPAFARIYKDVALREFNVALDERASRPATACVAEFTTLLGELRQSFSARSRSLHIELTALSQRLGDTLLSDIVTAFVQFHAQLYLHHFDDARGEFAI